MFESPFWSFVFLHDSYINHISVLRNLLLMIKIQLYSPRPYRDDYMALILTPDFINITFDDGCDTSSDHQFTLLHVEFYRYVMISHVILISILFFLKSISWEIWKFFQNFWSSKIFAQINIKSHQVTNRFPHERVSISRKYTVGFEGLWTHKFFWNFIRTYPHGGISLALGETWC